MARGTLRLLTFLLAQIPITTINPLELERRSQLIALRGDLPVNGYRAPYPQRKISQKKKRINFRRAH